MCFVQPEMTIIRVRSTMDYAPGSTEVMTIHSRLLDFVQRLLNTLIGDLDYLANGDFFPIPALASMVGSIVLISEVFPPTCTTLHGRFLFKNKYVKNIMNY